MASFHFMVDEKQNLNFDTSATTSCEQHAYRGSYRADATAEHEAACFHFMVHELQMPDNSLWRPVYDCSTRRRHTAGTEAFSPSTTPLHARGMSDQTVRSASPQRLQALGRW
eukprot:4922283-Prymnesium_polylepis.1